MRVGGGTLRRVLPYGIKSGEGFAGALGCHHLYCVNATVSYMGLRTCGRETSNRALIAALMLLHVYTFRSLGLSVNPLLLIVFWHTILFGYLIVYSRNCPMRATHACKSLALSLAFPLPRLSPLGGKSYYLYHPALRVTST